MQVCEAPCRAVQTSAALTAMCCATVIIGALCRMPKCPGCRPWRCCMARAVTTDTHHHCCWMVNTLAMSLETALLGSMSCVHNLRRLIHTLVDMQGCRNCARGFGSRIAPAYAPWPPRWTTHGTTFSPRLRRRCCACSRGSPQTQAPRCTRLSTCGRCMASRPCMMRPRGLPCQTAGRAPWWPPKRSASPACLSSQSLRRVFSRPACSGEVLPVGLMNKISVRKA